MPSAGNKIIIHIGAVARKRAISRIPHWSVAAGATAGVAGGFVARRKRNPRGVDDCISHGRDRHKATGYAGGAMADGVCHCRSCAMRYFLKNRPSAALIGNKIIAHIGAVARKRAISRIPHWSVAAGATAGVAGGFVGQGKRNQRGVDDVIWGEALPRGTGWRACCGECCG